MFAQFTQRDGQPCLVTVTHVHRVHTAEDGSHFLVMAPNGTFVPVSEPFSEISLRLAEASEKMQPLLMMARGGGATNVVIQGLTVEPESSSERVFRKLAEVFEAAADRA